MPDRKVSANTAYTTPVDGDYVIVLNTSDTTDGPAGTEKKTLWSNVKATLKAYFDTLYAAIGSTGSDFLSVLTATEISITTATALTIGRMHVISGSTNFTPTLPTAVGQAGKFIGARITNTGVTTIDANASETIDGVLTRNYFQDQAFVYMSNGSNWVTVQQKMSPRGQSIPILEFNTIAAITKVANASQIYNIIAAQTTPANGDWLEVGIMLNAGTYTCTVLGYSDNARGKLDWTLDGVSQTTGQDWYAASPTYNVEKTFTLTVPFTGYHVLRGTVNGKNASSSNYIWTIGIVSITPSAY